MTKFLAEFTSDPSTRVPTLLVGSCYLGSFTPMTKFLAEFTSDPSTRVPTLLAGSFYFGSFTNG
jgi:hypothetical protein